eukprot:6288240-Amphidinium_carterae.2
MSWLRLAKGGPFGALRSGEHQSESASCSSSGLAELGDLMGARNTRGRLLSVRCKWVRFSGRHWHAVVGATGYRDCSLPAHFTSCPWDTGRLLHASVALHPKSRRAPLPPQLDGSSGQSHGDRRRRLMRVNPKVMIQNLASTASRRL